MSISGRLVTQAGFPVMKIFTHLHQDVVVKWKLTLECGKNVKLAITAGATLTTLLTAIELK